MIRTQRTLPEGLDAFPDERSCYDYLQQFRWHSQPSCPRCSSPNIYRFVDKRNYKCADCKRRFSIRVGTIFEGSKIPLHKWFIAIAIVNSNNGKIASTELARAMGVTQKTAWLVLRRLHNASRTRSFNQLIEPIENNFGSQDGYG